MNVGRRVVTADERELIQHLAAEGWPVMKIAKALDRTHAVICRHLDPEQMELARQQSAKNRQMDGAAELDRQYRQQPEVKARKVAYLRDYQRRDDVREYQRQHQRSDSSRARRADQKRQAYWGDLQERIKHKMRGRINSALRLAIDGPRLRDNTPSVTLLGMDVLEWFELQPQELQEAFRNGEDVHIDEIRPCSSFDLSDRDQILCCFNWRNRQLLRGADNTAKGHRFTAADRRKWERMMRLKGWDGDLFRPKKKPRLAASA